ncbi:MAG: hypothetical protein ACTS5I_18150 [Rhodanobacter sp.]
MATSTITPGQLTAMTAKIFPEQAKSISLLIENEALLPMRSAVDTFGQLEELAQTIRDTARSPVDARSDHLTATRALMRIATLAEVAAYMASDIGNFVDGKREEIEDTHLQTVIDAVGRACHA